MTNSVMMPKPAPAPRRAYRVSVAMSAGGSETYKEEVRVLGGAGPRDDAVGRDHLDLDDVVEARSPHP